MPLPPRIVVAGAGFVPLSAASVPHEQGTTAVERQPAAQGAIVGRYRLMVER